jgi:hypothetical protein
MERPQILSLEDNLLDRVRILKEDEEETQLLTLDARVMAIRWDVIPWSLVLDVDVPVSEAEAAPIYRAWIVFNGVLEIYWPLLGTRLPNGCWLTSAINIEDLPDDFHEYSFFALLTRFAPDDSVIETPNEDRSIRIIAKRYYGIRSIETKVPSDYNTITRKERISLATDEEFLQALSLD